MFEHVLTRAGTIMSGALYTYAGDNVLQGFAACFWASLAFVVISGGGAAVSRSAWLSSTARLIPCSLILLAQCESLASAGV